MDDHDEDSRSRTVIAALDRLNLFNDHRQSSELSVWILGCDFREREPLRTFEILISECQARGITSLTLALIGPKAIVDDDEIMTKRDQCHIQVRSVQGLFHDVCDDLYREDLRHPDLFVCFQAGVWAYDTWKQSLERAVEVAPVVITSYNLEEAEDDNDQLTGWGFTDFLWQEEPNKGGASSYVHEERSLPRPVQENAYWQCLNRL